MFFDMLQPLDSHKFAGVKQVLNRNIAHTAKQHPVNPQLLVKAPLATPEHIEIGQEYATVRVRLHYIYLQRTPFGRTLGVTVHVSVSLAVVHTQCLRDLLHLSAKHFNNAVLTGHVEGPSV